MKIAFSDQKKTKSFRDEKRGSTLSKIGAGRKYSVISSADRKRIPVTSENDEFDLWDHNRGLETTGSRICWKPILFVLFIICTITLLAIFTPISTYFDQLFRHGSGHNVQNTCTSSCKIELVESIPEGLTYPDGSPVFLSTYEAWGRLIALAEKSIDMGSFYWTLRGTDFYNHSSAWQGEAIFNNLISAGTKRGIKIRIAQNAPTRANPNLDTEIMVKRKAAEVRSVDFKRLVGAGVLHTKLWIIDGQHMYVGSANMDWRSLTQVKELGVLLTNCSCLVDDVSKIFNVYWDMGKQGAVIPPNWPKEYSTKINNLNPVPVKFNQQYKMNTYFSSSPPPMSPEGRTQDIDSIVNVIQSAEKFIHISVMDYVPLTLYTPKPKFWPVIDNALREAAVDRRVSVKLLISYWNHSRPIEDYFLHSLQDISFSSHGIDIQVRRFICPATEDQANIPFARVNHNKYMVTDNVAYIGTSNWSGDYFINTAGIGFILEEASKLGGNETAQTIRKDLASVFERDWNSAYAVDLNPLRSI